MARGKYLSLEEARRRGRLDQFAKEHPSEADQEAFKRLLEIWPGESRHEKAEHQVGSLPKIEAELELPEVLRQEMGRDVDVRAADRPLQHRPERLIGVRVDGSRMDPRAGVFEPCWGEAVFPAARRTFAERRR